MSSKNIQVAIKKNVSADASGEMLTLYFLDNIQNPEYFDWNTMQIEEGSMVADLISQVNYYKPSRIMCEIDCMGGNLAIALAIYNYLKDYPAKVECKILGFCASAATVIACAASKGKLTMPVNGFYITHQASGWNIGGKAEDIRKEADVLDKYTRQMAEVLAARNTAGKTADDIMELWKDGDCWMTGEEAKAYGFVDDCYNAAAVVTARVDEAKTMFRNAPKSLVTAEVEQEAEAEPETATKSLIETLNNSFMDLKKLVTASLEALKGSKVNKNADNITAEIAEAIAQPLYDMTEGIHNEVTAAIAESEAKVTADVTKAVTDAVTAAMEEKYKSTIEAQDKKIADLQADLEKQAGKETAATTTTAAVNNNTRSLTGKFAGE